MVLGASAVDGRPAQNPGSALVLLLLLLEPTVDYCDAWLAAAMFLLADWCSSRQQLCTRL